MFFLYAGCHHNRVSYVMNVLPGCCGHCLGKNFKYSLVVTQDNCKYFHEISCYFCWQFFWSIVLTSKSYLYKKKLDKACIKNAELQAKELALIEKTSCLHKKHYVFFSCKLCFHKQQSVLSKKEKKMFVKKLVSIKDLKQSKQRVSESVRP